MDRKLYPQFIIDEEFRRSEQAISDEAIGQGSALDTYEEPIKLWGNIILEGFARYERCCQNNLPIRTQQIPVQDRREALSWACAVQLRRDDLNEDMRIYLLGKRYSVEKSMLRGDALRPDGIGPEHCTGNGRVHLAHRTAIRLGAEYGLARCTIARYGIYADAVDRLGYTAPKLVDLILSGRLGLSQREVIRLSELPKQKLQQAERDPQKYIVKNRLQSKKRGRPPGQHTDLSSSMSIKQMPIHDPDAEVSGLTLTIPSWISSIQRTHTVAEFAAISPQALERLTIQLSRLTESAEGLLAAIKEAS